MGNGSISINWRSLAETIMTIALVDATPADWQLFIDINPAPERSIIRIHLHMYKPMPPSVSATPSIHFIEEMSLAQCQNVRSQCVAEIVAAIGRLKQRMAAADLAGAEREAERLTLELRNRQAAD